MRLGANEPHLCTDLVDIGKNPYVSVLLLTLIRILQVSRFYSDADVESHLASLVSNSCHSGVLSSFFDLATHSGLAFLYRLVVLIGRQAPLSQRPRHFAGCL